MAKETKVGLLCEATGEITEFGVQHAENILKMQNSGWVLPEDSEYQRGEDGTISRRSKKEGDGKK